MSVQVYIWRRGGRKVPAKYKKYEGLPCRITDFPGRRSDWRMVVFDDGVKITTVKQCLEKCNGAK